MTFLNPGISSVPAPTSFSVYVASKFENVGEVRAIQAAVREAGLLISHDWTPAYEETRALEAEHGEHWWHVYQQSPQWAAYQAKAAREDLEGVAHANLFILLPYPGMKGAFVELGCALSFGLDIWVIGDRSLCENVFFHLRAYDERIKGERNRIDFYTDNTGIVSNLKAWKASYEAYAKTPYARMPNA